MNEKEEKYYKDKYYESLEKYTKTLEELRILDNEKTCHWGSGCYGCIKLAGIYKLKKKMTIKIYYRHNQTSCLCLEKYINGI